MRKIVLVTACLIATICGAGCTLFAEGNGVTVPKLKPEYTPIQDKEVFAKHLKVAYFAGGCFWGVQDAFNQIAGVKSTIVGYCGGKTTSPTYGAVCRHDTGHAETVRVVYDPQIISFTQLAKRFFEMHDPTTVNRQGPDIGDQYRSEIFYTDESQKADGRAAIAAKQIEVGSNLHVVTALEQFKNFYTAEDYHQNYIAKTGIASCHR